MKLHDQFNETGMPCIVRNARVVLPDKTFQHTNVIIENGRITDVAFRVGRLSGFSQIDAGGRLLVPGFIDLHSDAIENAIQPRPGGRFPIDVALIELDKQLASCGITSIFHCLCFVSADENPPFRNTETTRFLIDQIQSIRSSLNSRTHIHARYEITNHEAFTMIEDLVKNQRIDFFSVMDHTPGQGQFSDVKFFHNYYGKVRGISAEQLEKMILHRLEASKHIDWARLEYLMQLCRERQIGTASHDDDSAFKVKNMHARGAILSEFPVNLEAAATAQSLGMHVSLGSPNVLRGASLTGNLSARSALNAGIGTILCSDYSPMSLLHGAMTLQREGILSLEETLRLITLQPARAAGIDHFLGSIEPGKLADLVIIDDRFKVPRVCVTLVGGRKVYSDGS